MLVEEEPLHSLIQSLPDATLIVDEEGVVEASNASAAEIFGVPQEDLTRLDVLLPSYWVQRPVWMETLLKEGKTRPTTTEALRPDGRYLLVEIASAHVTYRGQRRLLVRLTDITKRRAAAQAASRLAAIVESSSDAIVGLSLEGRITSWNGGARAIFGYAPEEVIGQSLGVLFPERLDHERKLIFERLRAKLPVSFDTVRRKKDGSEVDVSVVVSPVVDETGNVIGGAGIARDVTERKRMERSLKSAHDRLQLAIETANIGIWVRDLATDRLELDDHLASLYELTEEDRVGDLFSIWRERVFPEDLARVDADLKAALDQGILRTHFRVQLPSGTTRHIHSAAVVERDPQGKPLRFLGVNRDVTTDVEQREEIESLKDRYEKLFRSSPDAYFLVDDSQTITDCNAAAESMLQVGRDQVLGRRLGDFSPPTQPDGQPSTKRLLDALHVARSGGAHRFEWLHRRVDGMEYWAEVMVDVVLVGGRPMSLVICRDITERHLEQSAQRRLAAIVEGSDDAIIGKTLSGVITSWNHGAERLFGYSPEETLGQRMTMLIPEHYMNEEKSILERILKNERVAPFDTVRRRKDGSYVHVSVTVSPVRDEDGTVVGASKILRDITQARERDEELRRSNSDLEQFAYVASHDLQEPLRMVANYTELLAQRYRGKLDERADKYLHYASDGARRMQSLVGDLLAYSRVGSQGKPFVPVDTNETVKHVARSLSAALEESGATLDVGELPVVLADPTQLHQLFQNLIANALKFRSEVPPTIIVRATEDGDRWRFSVADNGIGFDMRFADRIFQMFQRLHERERFSGSGIGLAIAKRVVERHGGTISVESTPGEGTTFFFTLRQVKPRP